MQFKRNIIPASLVTLLLLPFGMQAAETATKSENIIGGYNIPLITLIGLMLILLFFIGMLANTLRVLSEVLRNKIKTERAKGSGIVKTLLAIAMLLPALGAHAADAAVADVAVAAPKYIAGIPTTDYYIIIGFIAFELIIIFALSVYIRIITKTIKGHYDVATTAAPKRNWFWDDFNAAVPIEKEKDLLLDHNYDGIQELDNSLPPWWKYGFYLTIIVGVIYLYRYHMSGDGLSQAEEYAVEMQKGEEEKAAYLQTAGNKVDENSVTTLTDAGELAAGKELFSKNCVACHLADGGGSVGPNLTDEYWLHGGGIKDIFKTIKYGWQDKGMKSWKDDFSPKQIQQLASFVKSLKGTKPATPKAPQGEVYIEAGAAPAAGDTTAKPATKADSAKATAGVTK